MKGNEVIAEAAIKAGCRYFFGYPITPQSGIPEYMSVHLPERGGCFLQAESEVAAINMVMGCAASGNQVMTSSSGPGISLMSEGFSFIAACEIPAVIVDVMRGGPGLGSLYSTQGDYFQVTGGGGHGDYHLMVLAPGTLQEAVDMVQSAWDLAFRYRNPVMVLADAFMAQTMESVEITEKRADPGEISSWALGKRSERGGKRSVLKSICLNPSQMEDLNDRLQAKYRIMQKEALWETLEMEDARMVIAAFGTPGRISKTAVKKLRKRGYRVGLLRPKTLYPFPEEAFTELPHSVRHILSVEMNSGQMVRDIRALARKDIPVSHMGHAGCAIPSSDEIVVSCLEILEKMEGAEG